MPGYGDATEFRDGLEARHPGGMWWIARRWASWIRPPKATVPPYRGRGQPPRRHAYGHAAAALRAEAAAQATGWKTIRWRQGTKGWLTSRFVALRVQPSRWVRPGEPPHQEVWFAGGMAGGGESPHNYGCATCR